MCLRFCEFWTWRVVTAAIACVSVMVSFILGPIQTLVYLTDQRSAMAQLYKTEPHVAAILWLVAGLMWLLLVASGLLLGGCLLNSAKLVTAFVNMTYGHLSIVLSMCVKYAIVCGFMDKRCFDHSPARRGDDSLAPVGIALAFLVYAVPDARLQRISTVDGRADILPRALHYAHRRTRSRRWQRPCNVRSRNKRCGHTGKWKQK
ncbi:unnamed protein product, partial [Iphiclides podalirius]